MQQFKLKHQQFKNGKTKLVSELVFLQLSNKRVAFLFLGGEGGGGGHPVTETFYLSLYAFFS